MYKISVVGIDNSGKTSLVRSLEGLSGVGTIHLTAQANHNSRIARCSGTALGKLAKFGELNGLKTFTAAVYFLHLFPYYLEEREKRSMPVLVSDRDPTLDTLCHSAVYLPERFSDALRPTLQLGLSYAFRQPDEFFYLQVNPEASIRRNTKAPQIHDSLDKLGRLQHSLEQELDSAERRGLKVYRIDTEKIPLSQVIRDVKHYITTLSM